MISFEVLMSPLFEMFGMLPLQKLSWTDTSHPFLFHIISLCNRAAEILLPVPALCRLPPFAAWSGFRFCWKKKDRQKLNAAADVRHTERVAAPWIHCDSHDLNTTWLWAFVMMFSLLLSLSCNQTLDFPNTPCPSTYRKSLLCCSGDESWH